MTDGHPPRPAIDVQHVARLASLTLTEVEAARFAKELGTLVDYFAQLDELDTRDVVPTAHVQLDRLPWREDEERPGLSRDDALAEAPSADADGFAVPAFVE